MAEKVTIYNFIAWLREQIEPDQLSALITGYNYTDDSDETIIDALTQYPSFKDDLGRLLGENIKANQAELNRSVGGISFESNSLSLKDWKKIAKQGINRADGVNISPASTTTKSSFDWNALVQGVLNTAAAVLGGSTKSNTGASDVNDQPKSNSGSTTALWIIIGVVVIAIVAILWMSLSKK